MIWMQLDYTQFLENLYGVMRTSLFFNSYGGVRLSASGTLAINGHVVSVAVIDEYGVIDEIRTDSENHNTRGKLAPLLISSL
jgi:hypothetical protein